VLRGVLVPALLAALVTAFVFTTVGVEGVSMMPTLRDGDRAWVPRYETWLRRAGVGEWRSGDVVYFRPPGAEPSTWLERAYGGPFLIKRVIASAGETVEIRRGEVWVDGVRLAEPYLEGIPAASSRSAQRVPPEHVFVLGDNRAPLASRDSRAFGPVPVASIAGRASAVIWPLFVPDGDGGWRWYPHRL
jgi:signal peptidase I